MMVCEVELNILGQINVAYIISIDCQLSLSRAPATKWSWSCRVYINLVVSTY